MLIAVLSALVLQVAPAHYDAKFSCDCRPHYWQTSGAFTTTARANGDFDYTYPGDTGGPSLSYAMQAGRWVVADSPGLAPSSKWRSTVDVLVIDQTFPVPVDASVVSVENGVATVQVHGELDGAHVQMQLGTIPTTIKFDLIEHIKLGQSADEPPSLISLIEGVVQDFQPGGNQRPFEATVKCELTASEATPKASQ